MYRLLLPQLRETADTARRLFAAELGVAVSRFEVEGAIAPRFGYTPTFKVLDRDKYLVAIEVADGVPQSLLAGLVLPMKNEGYPAKVIVAIPEGPQSATFREDIRIARQNGIGLVEVGPSGISRYQEAIRLNLSCVRRPVITDFRPSLRGAITASLTTFEGGNPKKACSTVDEAIEGITRKVAALARAKGAFAVGAPSFVATTPWGKIAALLYQFLDLRKTPFTRLTKSLLGRVAGLTEHRNQVNHPARTLEERRRIDSELRTRYEHSCDVLRELAKAVPRNCLT